MTKDDAEKLKILFESLLVAIRKIDVAMRPHGIEFELESRYRDIIHRIDDIGGTDG